MCVCVCVCVLCVCVDAFARNTFNHGHFQVLKVWKKCHEVNISGAECFVHNFVDECFVAECFVHSGKEGRNLVWEALGTHFEVLIFPVTEISHCLCNATSCDANIAFTMPQVVMRVLPWQCRKL